MPNRNLVNMCREAIDILPHYKLRVGNYFAGIRVDDGICNGVETADVGLVLDADAVEFIDTGRKNPIFVETWKLYRQCDSQDLFNHISVDPQSRKLVKALWDWIAETSPKLESMEELWFGYVVFYLTGKNWNGEKFI